MAKSNPVDETIADPVERAKHKSRANVKKARKLAKAQKSRTRSKGAVGSRNGTKPASGKQTKQQTCLALLGRREGATIEDLEQVTGWQKYSVRGFLAGAVRKKLGLHYYRRSPTRAPAAIASRTRPNAMDRYVLAEHNGRRRRGGEHRGSPR